MRASNTPRIRILWCLARKRMKISPHPNVPWYTQPKKRFMIISGRQSLEFALIVKKKLK